jgi:hypothetical protein
MTPLAHHAGEDSLINLLLLGGASTLPFMTAAGRDRSAGSHTGGRADDRPGESQVPGRAASAATRKPMFPVELSGVFELRAPTR